MKRLIQISDSHIVGPPALISARLDTAELLRQTVERIAGVIEKTGPVAALLVTGDVTDDGSEEGYALFRQIVAPLGLPVLALPGNHDRREPMRRAFADTGLMPESGKIDWVRDLDGLRVIGLDTLVEGTGGGALDAATLDFLQTALDTAPQVPVIVALHHPPFITGIRFMDAIGLENHEPFADIVRRSIRDIHVVCGHIHTVQIASAGGASALSCPAVCSTFDVDFRTDASVGFMDAPGGFVLHDWEHGLRSLIVPLDPGAGPFPF